MREHAHSHHNASGSKRNGRGGRWQPQRSVAEHELECAIFRFGSLSGITLSIYICLIYLSALFMASIKDLEKALSATAVARQGRIYRKTLYGDFCRYES